MLEKNKYLRTRLETNVEDAFKEVRRVCLKLQLTGFYFRKGISSEIQQALRLFGETKELLGQDIALERIRKNLGVD